MAVEVARSSLPATSSHAFSGARARKQSRQRLPKGAICLSSFEVLPGQIVQRYRLANGLRVVLAPEASKHSVNLQLWVDAGSRDDPAGLSGLAHLVEHVSYLRPLGLRSYDQDMDALGAEANATTWTDWTQYHVSCASEDLGHALTLEAARFHGLWASNAGFETERRIALVERLQRVDADEEARASEALYPLAYRTHPYRRPTIGWRRDIRRATLEDCRQFFDRHYRPGAMVVTLCGGFEPHDALRQVAATFGQLRPRSLWRRRPTGRAEAPQARLRQRVLAHAGEERALVLGFKAPSVLDPDWAALALAQEALWGPFGSLREPCLVANPRLRVSTELTPFRDTGLFEVFLRGLRSQYTASSVIDNMATAAAMLQPDAVQQARAQLRIQLNEAVLTLAGLSAELAFYELIAGDAGRVRARLAGFPDVDAARVRSTCARYLRRGNASAVELRPAASGGV